MNVFTEVYDKSRDLLKVQCFDNRWSNIEPKIKALLAADGFSDAEAPVLDLIRSSLNQAAGRTSASIRAMPRPRPPSTRPTRCP